MKKKPTILQALTPIIFIVVALTIGYGYFKMKIEPLMVISAFVAGSIALKLGYTWKEMQDAIIEKISSALPATLILWSVGFLIGALMFSGTVPMIIYYGVQMINPKFLLVTAFILSALLSTITGTSWGAAGTIGVAIMGIAGGLGVSLPATAGAVVSGAFFGDKLSYVIHYNTSRNSFFNSLCNSWAYCSWRYDNSRVCNINDGTIRFNV